MRVQLCICAKDLPAPNDAFATVALDGEELGRTEVIPGSASPDWEKVFVFDFDDGEAMTVTAAVCSEGDDGNIGTAEFDVADVLERKVVGKAMEGGGLVFAHAAERDAGGSLKIQICAKGLQNTEGFLGFSRDKSDPFYNIRRTSGDVVYSSEVVMENLNPVFPEVEIPLESLCDGDLDAPLKLVVYDYDPDGSHDYMGHFHRSVNGLLSANAAAEAIDLIKNGRESGEVLVLGAELVDYVNPREVARVITEAAATAMATKADAGAKSEAAAVASQKAEKARIVVEEKEANAQAVSEQLAEAEKAAAEAKEASEKAAEEAASQPAAGILSFQLKGEKLKNTEGFFRKPDPFFVLQKASDVDGETTWSNVHVSDVDMDTLNPSWAEAEVDISALGSGDLDEPLRVVVFDKERDGKHVLMGFFETSINGLLLAKKSDDSISMAKGGSETGHIIVADADLTGYVDPKETAEKLKGFADEAEEARFFVMGKKAAAKRAADEAEEAKSVAEALTQEAEAAAEEAEAAKKAAEEAADQLADAIA